MKKRDILIDFESINGKDYQNLLLGLPNTKIPFAFTIICEPLNSDIVKLDKITKTFVIDFKKIYKKTEKDIYLYVKNKILENLIQLGISRTINPKKLHFIGYNPELEREFLSKMFPESEVSNLLGLKNIELKQKDAFDKIKSPHKYQAPRLFENYQKLTKKNRFANLDIEQKQGYLAELLGVVLFALQTQQFDVIKKLGLNINELNKKMIIEDLYQYNRHDVLSLWVLKEEQTQLISILIDETRQRTKNEMLIKMNKLKKELKKECQCNLEDKKSKALAQQYDEAINQIKEQEQFFHKRKNLKNKFQELITLLNYQKNKEIHRHKKL